MIMFELKLSPAQYAAGALAHVNVFGGVLCDVSNSILDGSGRWPVEDLQNYLTRNE